MYTLLILFMINGELALVDGWYPIETDSLETCLELKENITTYLDKTKSEFLVSCEVTFQ